MKYLLDTHLLVWIAEGRSPLPPAREQALSALVNEKDGELYFSAVSIWELAIKRALKRPDFAIEPTRLSGLLRASGFREIHVTAEQAVGVAELPRLHGDPFDRLLIAQAHTDNLTLLTADRQIARYPGPIRRV